MHAGLWIDRAGWSGVVDVVARPDPEPDGDDGGAQGQDHADEEEAGGDVRLAEVALEVLGRVVFPRRAGVVHVVQELAGGGEPRAHAAGQNRGDHLQASACI